LFAIESGFSPEVGFALAVLVKSRLPGNAVLIKSCRDLLRLEDERFEQQVTEAEHAWSSFVVFCGVFVDFLPQCAHPRPIGLMPLLRQILAVLPIRTPKLLAGVLGLVEKVVTVDGDAAALFAGAIMKPRGDLETILMRPAASPFACRNRLVRRLEEYVSTVRAALPAEGASVNGAYRWFWAQWPSRSPRTTADFIIRSLRDPSFFVSECGHDVHVQFVFAMIANTGVEASAQFVETYRETVMPGVEQAGFMQELLETERAWSSFTVFCGILADLLDLWDGPASQAFVPTLTYLFGVLPLKTPPLLTGVVQLLVMFAQKLTRDGPGVSNQRDKILEFLAIAIRGKDLDKVELQCTKAQRETWALKQPQHEFARPPSRPAISVRRMIREFRRLAEVITPLSFALPTNSDEAFVATPKCTEYWQAVKHIAVVKL
jgi:hypothetical protein